VIRHEPAVGSLVQPPVGVSGAVYPGRLTVLIAILHARMHLTSISLTVKLKLLMKMELNSILDLTPLDSVD